jgi:hypothetical protein
MPPYGLHVHRRLHYAQGLTGLTVFSLAAYQLILENGDCFNNEEHALTDERGDSLSRTSPRARPMEDISGIQQQSECQEMASTVSRAPTDPNHRQCSVISCHMVLITLRREFHKKSSPQGGDPTGTSHVYTERFLSSSRGKTYYRDARTLLAAHARKCYYYCNG